MEVVLFPILLLLEILSNLPLEIQSKIIMRKLHLEMLLNLNKFMFKLLVDMMKQDKFLKRKKML